MGAAYAIAAVLAAAGIKADAAPRRHAPTKPRAKKASAGGARASGRGVRR
jgi:hypothetical protein